MSATMIVTLWYNAVIEFGKSRAVQQVRSSALSGQLSRWLLTEFAKPTGFQRSYLNVTDVGQYAGTYRARRRHVE